jgi:serine/threonine protein phosphatase 1
MPEILQHFARNTAGRDFVCGDIHGRFDLLRQALEAVDFEADRDRLFTVGDLIDRGPYSAEATDWLAKPWLHACLGNHEEMALEAVHTPLALLNWVAGNGGDWWLHEMPEAQQRHLAAFAQLPLAMEIETVRGRVGIVHADIPPGLDWPGFVAGLLRADSSVLETALWGRQRAAGGVSHGVAGIDQVVCGHSIAADHKVHHVGNVWLIDTGAFTAEKDGGCLSLLTLDSLFADGQPIAVPPCSAAETVS